MKKMIICIAFLFSFFTVFFFTKAETEKKIIVVLDAGHGGMDGGACVGTITEAELTLAITKKTKEIFEQNGVQVLLTRENEDDLSPNEFVKRQDMLKRVSIINSSQASLAISIHLNKFSIEKYRGAQVFYSNTNQMNAYFADVLQKNLIQYLKNTDRSIVKRDNIFLLNKVVIPCCIVECGFMSNNEELALLQSEDYQYKLAYALWYGVEDFLKLY